MVIDVDLTIILEFNIIIRGVWVDLKIWPESGGCTLHDITWSHFVSKHAFVLFNHLTQWTLFWFHTENPAYSNLLPENVGMGWHRLLSQIKKINWGTFPKFLRPWYYHNLINRYGISTSQMTTYMFHFS